MMHGHFRHECCCGNVLSQCRCPLPYEPTSVRERCTCETPGPKGRDELSAQEEWHDPRHYTQIKAAKTREEQAK